MSKETTEATAGEACDTAGEALVEHARRFETAGEALVEVAKRFGTEACFGIVSIHNQPLVDAIVHGLRFVPVRHEASAVNAADAYARASGNLGIAVTSTGTGAGNAAGSLIEALTAGSAVLHVTGQIDSEFVGDGRGVIHETKDQPAMLDAVSKRTIAVRAGDDVGAALLDAATVATEAPTGPVSIEIPIDLQYRATTLGPVPDPDPLPGPDRSALDAAVDRINAARRPLVWLGGGAIGARAAIDALVSATGAGVLTSNAGRGTIDERDERVIGNFAATPGCAQLLADADLLISIGTHFRSNETRHYKLALPTPHIQIDIDPAAIGRVYGADVGLVGDAAEVVGGLVTQIAPSVDPGWAEQIRATRAQVRAALRADIGPYAELCDAMRGAMHDASPFVRDVTIPASAWGNRLLDVYDPRTNINARGGGIGQGLGMAIGAAVARPEVPTMVMVGDGGVQVHLGEFATIAGESPWMVIVLFNDGGYGVLRNLQDAHFGRRSGVDLTTPNFAALASAFGIEHRLLSDPAAAKDALTEAVSIGAPVIVEVDIDRFGPMPKPFVPPVPVER